MPQGRFIAIAGVAVVAVLVVAVAIVQFAGNGPADNDLAASPPGEPATPGPEGTPAGLDDLDDLGDLSAEPEAPPEVLAFIETFDAAGSVIHFAIEQEIAEEQVGPEGQSFVRADIWMEIADDQTPARFVGRFFDQDGELLQAMYTDGEEEILALIHETRMNEGAAAEGCVQRGPGSMAVLLESTPLVVDGEQLQMQGFSEAERTFDIDPASTNVDERVGDPVRIVSLPQWADARQYESAEAEGMGRLLVVLDPQTGLLMGQLALGPSNAENGNSGEIELRQAMGDLHFHERGTADALFDIEDALAICAELEGVG